MFITQFSRDGGKFNEQILDASIDHYIYPLELFLKHYQGDRMENFKLLFIVAFAMLLVGCSSINTNVAMFGTENYREGITSSENYRNLKEYLLNNDIKLYPIVSVSNSPSGALGRIPVNGTALSMVSKDNNKWLQDSMNTLINSELQGIVLNKYDEDALILT
ncbi:hypothetical protein [Methylomonas methanica]|nr:hypothetical protein [Methylomonas methanica]